jgi:hypothetical protein
MKTFIGVSCVILSSLFFIASFLSFIVMLAYSATGFITEIKSETTSFYNILFYVASLLFFQLPGVILFIFGLVFGFIASRKLS